MGYLFYKQRLSHQEQVIYEQVFKELIHCTKEFEIKAMQLNSFQRISCAILMDNPFLYYVSDFRFRMYGKRMIVSPNYIYTINEIKNINVQLEYRLQTLIKSLKNNSDYITEINIHTYLCNNIKYENFGKESFNVIGVLLRNKGVCEGVAKTVKLLCDNLHINCFVVSGKGINQGIEEEHAWNIIEIDNQFYHLDVTFDLTLKDKTIRYDYFNLTDKQIINDHNSDILSYQLCRFDKWNYYKLNNLIMNNTNDFRLFLRKNITTKGVNFQIKLPEINNSDNVLNKIISIIEEEWKSKSSCQINIIIRPNKKQMIFEGIVG